ncbi:MAG: hypothetical protein VCB26_11495 [Candidatus Hydrogenedentota bacterium]
MNMQCTGLGRLSCLSLMVMGATLLSWSPGVSAEDASTPVRGAHESFDANEKTDDLGITVPMAPVSHPARRYPASEEFPTGPAVGERLPEFTLSNQDGEPINFHEDRGGSKAIVVFYRSVVW